MRVALKRQAQPPTSSTLTPPHEHGPHSFQNLSAHTIHLSHPGSMGVMPLPTPRTKLETGAGALSPRISLRDSWCLSKCHGQSYSVLLGLSPTHVIKFPFDFFLLINKLTCAHSNGSCVASSISYPCTRYRANILNIPFETSGNRKVK